MEMVNLELVTVRVAPVIRAAHQDLGHLARH
jgi:hypothetical protein